MYGKKIILSIKDLRLRYKIFRLPWRGPVKFWNVIDPLEVEQCWRKSDFSKRTWRSNCSLPLPVPLCFLNVDT